MRSAFDRLISGAGLLIALMLLVAGGLLTWATSFIGDQVRNQLVMQDITMPEGKALDSLPQADADALRPYAGSVLDTGAKAKAFADHYILVHMNASSDNRTYEEVSGEYVAMTDAQKASDEGQALAGLRQSLFMGNTLRGLLLYGYAFATIGAIAGYAAIAAFVGAALMLLLAFLGYRHAKRQAAEAPVVGGSAQPATA